MGRREVRKAIPRVQQGGEDHHHLRRGAVRRQEAAGRGCPAGESIERRKAVHNRLRSRRVHHGWSPDVHRVRIHGYVSSKPPRSHQLRGFQAWQLSKRSTQIRRAIPIKTEGEKRVRAPVVTVHAMQYFLASILAINGLVFKQTCNKYY